MATECDTDIDRFKFYSQFPCSYRLHLVSVNRHLRMHVSKVYRDRRYKPGKRALSRVRERETEREREMRADYPCVDAAEYAAICNVRATSRTSVTQLSSSIESAMVLCIRECSHDDLTATR